MKKIMTILAFVVLMVLGGYAQNSLPAPGSGGAYTPNPGPGPLGPSGIGWNPGPAYPNYYGSPWTPGWMYSPTIVVNQPALSNQGVTRVVACGYDAQGIWRVLPLTVSYQYNGFDYNVNVLNAWNPWTDQWDKGVDLPAYSTSYTLRGITYDYYTVLPVGTFYFNL